MISPALETEIVYGEGAVAKEGQHKEGQHRDGPHKEGQHKDGPHKRENVFEWLRIVQWLKDLFL